MKRLLVLAWLLAGLTLAYAGSITKRYLTFQNPDGMLYFFTPTQMPGCEGNVTRQKMTFDITYLTDSPDSVSLTTTIYLREMTHYDSLHIHSGGETLTAALEQLYCEPHRGGYVLRTRAYITWPQLQALYAAEVPYTVDFGPGARYAFTQKKWEKERSVVKSIFNIILFNSEKQ